MYPAVPELKLAELTSSAEDCSSSPEYPFSLQLSSDSSLERSPALAAAERFFGLTLEDIFGCQNGHQRKARFVHWYSFGAVSSHWSRSLGNWELLSERKGAFILHSVVQGFPP